MAQTVTRKLDFSKLNHRKAGYLSTQEALKDIVPINWPQEVVNGSKKVVLTKDKK